MENKINTITNLFDGSEIRSIWDSEKGDYYFSVVDVISVLTESNNPRNYCNMLKKRVKEDERSELHTNCVQLKMKSQSDAQYGITIKTIDLTVSEDVLKANIFEVFWKNLKDTLSI